MKSVSKRKLATGATVLVALAGAGGAVAATQGSGNSGDQAYINDVAHRLNVSPAALTSAMKGALSDRIDAAVAAGRLTQAKADALKQRIKQGASVPFLGHGYGAGFAHRGFAGGLGAAAQYLGVSRATLRSDLQSGQSLAKIASTTPGKSVDGLKAALTAAANSKLAAGVSAGRITSQQEQQRLSNLSSRIDALVQRSGIGDPAGGPGLGLRGH